MSYLILSISVIFAYLIGSIPTSYLVGKLFKKIDIRKFGSGNVGATNALRVLGVKIGVFVLIVDISKGILSILMGKTLLKSYFEDLSIYLVFIALAAILGHIFTIFLGFKGGKGVATSAGVFVALTPVPFTMAIIVFITVVAISKYVSLGSISAAVVLFITELIINFKNAFSEIELLILVTIVAVFIIVKHKGNIKRLLNGNENKLKFNHD